MATFLNSGPQAVAQGLFEDSTTPQHKIGEIIQSADGRVFRYAQTGAVALVPGKLQQSLPEVTANQNLTAVAAAAGATTVVSTSTVTVTANQYAGGYIMVSVTPDAGYSYLISDHAAYTGAAPTFNLSDAIVNAWTTSTRFDLVSNPYLKIVVNPSTATSAPVGVAMIASAISSYSWIQTRGAASILADGTVTVGTDVVASNATAGAVEALTGVQAIVGNALSGIATTEYGPIFMLL